MSTLTIHDLPQTQTLDRRTLARTVGGYYFVLPLRRPRLLKIQLPFIRLPPFPDPLPPVSGGGTLPATLPGTLPGQLEVGMINL